MTTDDPLRLWLRLFTCSTMIERSLGARLKRAFGSSLPRFDLLAQLDRAPGGLRMTVLSKRLLVTGGNVTWLVTSLAKDGYVRRTRADDDGRAVVVTLTAAGRRHFRLMARAHQDWVADLLGPLPVATRRTMFDHLSTLKRQLAPESV